MCIIDHVMFTIEDIRPCTTTTCYLYHIIPYIAFMVHVNKIGHYSIIRYLLITNKGTIELPCKVNNVQVFLNTTTDIVTTVHMIDGMCDVCTTMYWNACANC